MRNLYILNNSDLLIPDNCVVFNHSFYEKLYDHEHEFRLFISIDDYDYVEDEVLISQLSVII